MDWKNVLAAFGLGLVFIAATTAQASGQSTSKDIPGVKQVKYAPPDFVTTEWVGDLDGMIKRRGIRILVPYSKTFYFIDRGTQRGVTFDAFKLVEKDLNQKLKGKHLPVHVVFIPTPRDQLIPSLLKGRGDIAAGNLTITPERLNEVDFSDPTYENVSEIVVTGPGAAPIGSVDDLSGKDVYIRKSSSYFESIQQLNAEFAKAGKKPVQVRFAPETFESEDILEMVNAGLVKMTIIDNHIVGFWATIFPGLTLHKEAAIRTGGKIAWMIRKNSPKLKGELNAAIARYPKGSSVRNQLFQNYARNIKLVKNATSPQDISRFEQIIEFFRKYGDQYSLEYLLMMAQGYQESQLRQEVKSAVGAVGVMQVMPSTGNEMHVGDIHQIEPNIHAGVKYFDFMMNQYFGNEPMDALNKGLFTFASYNAGPARIAKFRKLAAQRGLNPNLWFNNVEVIALEKIGRETVQYVGNIYKYYLAYQMVQEQKAEKEKAKEAAKVETGKE